jgi:hypothetical protein
VRTEGLGKLIKIIHLIVLKVSIVCIDKFCYCQVVLGLLQSRALSDDRTGLKYTIAVGPQQSMKFHDVPGVAYL